MDIRKLVSAPIAFAAAGFIAVGAFLASDRMEHAWIWLLLLFLFLGLAVLVAFLVWRRWKALQAAAEIEKKIVLQADRAIEKSTFGQLDEMKNLKRDLLDALEALKKSSLVKRSGSDALSQLPWYMILGPADSGKGTLVRRAGLHFVLQDDDKKPRSVKGIGGTRAFEWWLAEEGVLLDMSGRTLKRSEFDDNDDWEEFLGVLRENRPGKALNGVVVVVAVDQLAGRPDSQIDGLAQQVRDRIHDLTEKLKVVFPVYVVFTRCDRIAGFAEFFEDSPPEERDEIWGATFKQSRARASRAEALFHEEFAHMLGALSDRRLRRAAALPDEVQRARAFVFPLQLERIEPMLARFVAGVFKSGGVSETAPMRGFYFASAYAGAETDDRVLLPAVRDLGLSMAASTVPPVGDAPWFARDLFTQIVFPDAQLATVSQGAIKDEAEKARRMRTLSAVAFAALALVLSVWSCSNLALVGRARDAARGTREITTLHAPSTLPLESLAALDRLRKAADELDERGRHRPFLPPFYATAGGLRDDATGTLALRSSQAMYGLAGHALHAALEEDLARTDSRFVNVFLRYRAWRMLTADRVSVVPQDAPVLGMEVDEALSDSRDAARLHGKPEDAAAFSAMVRRQVEFYTAHSKAYLNVDVADLQVDPNLDARVADWLATHWDVQQVYDRLVADESATYPAQDLAGLVGPPTLLAGTYKVPGAFTRKAWREGVYARMLWTDNQVTVDKPLQQAFQAHSMTPPQMLPDLVARYAKDYSQQWCSLLVDAKIALTQPPTFDYKVSANAVELASNGGSQIHRLLDAVREQTHFDKDPGASSLAGVSRDFDATRLFFSNPEMDAAKKVAWWKRPFAWVGGLFHKVGPASGSVAKSELARAYHDLMAQATSDLTDLAQAKPSANFGTALTSAQRRFISMVGTPLSTSGTGEAGLEPIKRLLELPLAFAFNYKIGSVVGAGGGGGGGRGGAQGQPAVTNTAFASALHDAIGQVWTSQLAPYYPFNRGAAQDVDPAVLKSFLGPGGQFWQALTSSGIAQGVDETGASIAPNAGGVPEDLRACIKRAFEIRQALFSSGAPGMKVLLEPEQVDPASGAPAIDWVSLAIGGGQPYRYDATGFAAEQAIDWPGNIADQGATLSMMAGARPLVQPGMWGLFRLLDKGTVSDAGGQVKAVWTIPTAHSSARVTWKFRVANTPRNPFQRDFFSGFKIP